ncbi:hypothetical protein NP511_16175 [Natrinema thermotolerans]|uniref:Uncharacterized protein n=1 Tax=Natrinema thermotolerans TaxID=121872 RepID=A0AAF0PDY2_9EURY|nr:hypothetical protein [Natrinema thermotolerans]WMT06913.1 hypothetical protein NP511_16175 [Natrinema thermotolerans]
MTVVIGERSAPMGLARDGDRPDGSATWPGVTHFEPPETICWY